MPIRDVIAVMNQMHADGVIDGYAIGGAVAATFYLEPVATVDVDIFVMFRGARSSTLINPQPVFDHLKAQGFRMEGEYVMIAGWPVQLLAPAGPLGDEALAQAFTREVAGVPARVLTAEHLAAIALQTGRGKDKARLLQFIEAGALDPTVFEGIVERHGLDSQWQLFRRNFLPESP